MNEIDQLKQDLEIATQAGDEELSNIISQKLQAIEGGGVSQGVTTTPQTAAPQVPQYDDVPSVPDALAIEQQDLQGIANEYEMKPTTSSPDASPADNLANQTTNNQNWLDKITKSLYGDRYSGVSHLVGQAEITPAGPTMANLAGKDYSGITGEFQDQIDWSNELSSPQFMTNVGIILGPMLAQAIAPSVQLFRTLPAQAKVAALIPLMTTLMAVTGGAISDVIRKGPLATTPLGEFDFSGDTLGEKAYSAMFSDPNTIMGRAQQGMTWGTLPEVALGGLGMAGRKTGQAIMGLKPKAIRGLEGVLSKAEHQLGAAERISEITPQNINALNEFHRMRQSGPAGVLKSFLPEKVPFSGRFVEGGVKMPEAIRGPAEVIMDPTRRVLAGQIPTEPYVAAGTAFGKASGAIAPIPVAGSNIRKSAGYASGQAIKNVERMLDEISPSGPTGQAKSDAEVSAMAYQGAQDFGVRRVNKHARLYKIADDKAATLPGLDGNPPGYVVPTGRIIQAADDVLAEARGGPLKRSGEPVNVNRAELESAKLWADEMAELGEYATIAQIRNLQTRINKDLKNLVPSVDRGAAVQYRAALKESINTDMVAALEVAGIAEGRAVANAYNAANRSVALTKQVTQGPAGKQFTKVNDRFWDEKALTGGFVQPGSKEADELFTFAFNARDPQYLKTMRTIMGKDAYNAASRLYLSKAINSSMVGQTGGMAQIDRQVFGMEIPVKFNLGVFRKGLGYEGGVLPVGANETLKQLLKGTGSRLTTQTLDDLGTILSRYPINMDLATMAARRIPLAGTKGALSAITGGVAKAGAVAGSGVVGGVKGAALAFTLLVGLNNLGRIITSDAMLKSLVRYARTADKANSSKFASKYAKNIQRTAFVKLWTQWGYDAVDAEELFENIEGTGQEVKYYADNPEEVFNVGSRVGL